MKKIFFIGFIGLYLLVIVSAGGEHPQEKKLDEFFFGLVEKVKSIFGEISGASYLVSALESNIRDRNGSLVNSSEDDVNATDSFYLENISEINFTEEENATLLNFSSNETNLSQIKEESNNSYLNETEMVNDENDSIQFVLNYTEEIELENETEYFYWDRLIMNNYFEDSEEINIKLKVPKRLQNITKGIDYEEKNNQGEQGFFSIMDFDESQKLNKLKQELKKELKNKYSEAEIENISIIKKIKFNELELDDDFSLGVEELNLSNSVQSYAIDPSRLNFTNASVSLIAKGEDLYKCKDWNFSEQVCYGEWELFRSDLVPGEEYSFVLTPDDPAFSEEINVTDAVHLDENRSFVSNIFDEIRYQDGLWSEAVYHDEYVRATFEENLNNGSVINFYVRNNESLETYIVVYEEDGGEILALTPVIVDGEYNIKLSNVPVLSNVFDFKIVNKENDSSAYLEFDYIHDAASLSSFDGNFYEGFESGSLATNGWTTSGAGAAWTVGDAESTPHTGNYSIRAENTDGESIVETGLDTTNYQNITFSFWAFTEGLDTGEYVVVDWYNGTSWINVLNVEDILSYTFYSYNLTSDANGNSDFAIRFRCSSNGNNEDCEVDDINVTGVKLIDISLDDFYGLNSSLGRVDEFNSSNLEEIEYMELNFSIDSSETIDSWYFNFTANGTNGCALGNKQSSTCYTYPNWIQFINNTNTSTYDGTQGNQGDRIIAIQTGSGNNVNISLRIDEHYNPNVFKWYDALYNFSDVKWQNGTEQKITGNNHIKIEINQTLVPLDADQYKLDFRADMGGSPTQPLEAYACNSSYVDGHVHDFAGCVLVAQRFPSEFQDIGTKFREVFTKNLTNQIGDFKYIVLETLEQNTSNYYAIKTYKANRAGYTTHWEYSTNLGDSWTNLGDDYETELNINWFYSGADSTAFVYRFWANTSSGSEDYLEGNITWDIDYVNYRPLVDLRSPTSVEYVSFPYNVTFVLSDSNNDNLNGSLFLYQGGSLNKTLVTDMNQSNESYIWDDSTPDGTYDLILEVCELGTSDLFCVNITREITVDNYAPSVFSLAPVANTTYYDNVTNTIEIAANVTDALTVDVFANISYPDGTYVSVNLTNVLGDKYNTSFQIPFVSGRYNVTIVADDVAENSNDTETTYFNLEDVSVPSVEIVYPLNHTLDEDEDVAISLNISDASSLDTIYANISSPNGTNYTLTDFATGLPSDDFSGDSEGVNWVHANDSASGQICYMDIDETVPGKMFFSVDGGTGPTTLQCSYNSLKRMDGDFDLNLSFNITLFEPDSFFTLRSAPVDLLSASGIRVYMVITKINGENKYRFGYNDGTNPTNVTEVFTNDTYGKFRIKRFNFSTGTPIFNLYYWNNSGSEWINVHGNISLPGSSRAQYLQIKPGSEGSEWGKMNLTIDDFFISGDNYTFGIFNQTSQVGQYNVSIFVNDSLGNVNDSETTTFHTEAVNDAPSRPYINEPDIGDFVSGLYNISWGTVTDSEGDSLRFNISLLNPDESINATIVSNYGDSGSVDYECNSSLYVDGNYGLKVEVYENETVEGNSNSDTLGGNFTIDNTYPQIQFVSPTTDAGNHSQDFIVANVTVIDDNIDTITISLYNSSGIVNSTFSSGSPLFVNFANLPYETYYLNATVNDSAGNINQTETKTIVLEVVDSCTYSGSGNWDVDCSDNCSITSDVDVLGNNISIVGSGNFYTTANVTNFSDLYVAGDSDVSRCEVYCSGGGCFR